MRPGEHHDVSYVAVTRPVRRDRSLSQKRMGWRIKWLSSYGSDFNYDFRVSFTEDEIACGEAYYNYDMRPIAIDELSGRSVFNKDATVPSSTPIRLMRAAPLGKLRSGRRNGARSNKETVSPRRPGNVTSR